MIIIDDDGVMHKVFTKDEVVAMLKEIQLEIEESPVTDDGIRIEDYSIYERGYEQATLDYSKIIQQKIDKLKEDKKSE